LDGYASTHASRQRQGNVDKTLNFYNPPAYTKSGDELPPAKP